MVARNVWAADLESALAEANKVFADNIKWRGEPTAMGATRGKGSFRFTLGLVSSKGPGHRRGFPHYRTGAPGKRLAYACWHVHGVFFDALLKIAPEAVIIAGSSLANPKEPARITKEGGNWGDWQIGSQAYPLMYSEACDCAEEGLEDLIFANREHNEAFA